MTAGPRESPTQARVENECTFSIRGFEGLGSALQSGERLPAALSRRGWGQVYHRKAQGLCGKVTEDFVTAAETVRPSRDRLRVGPCGCPGPLPRALALMGNVHANWETLGFPCTRGPGVRVGKHPWAVTAERG